MTQINPVAHASACVYEPNRTITAFYPPGVDLQPVQRVLADAGFGHDQMQLLQNEVGLTEQAPGDEKSAILLAPSFKPALQTLDLGACALPCKRIELQSLLPVVQQPLPESNLQDEAIALRAQLQTRYGFRNILSKNECMHAVFELITNVARTNTTVLIEGETGTGKEEVARAIHEASQHRSGPLVAVNCAALAETLLDSELFGHEKGSFTSAVGQRRGRFEIAHGGTILLDEVGDVPATMQAKLLRVLQERRFERVGGTKSIEVDVRVIAATNRSLRKLVKRGTFREDLYYRLNVVKIELPPLRDRPEDIPLLASYFIHKYGGNAKGLLSVAPQVMDKFLNYRWPGNIRELENAIEHACVTCQENTIQFKDLPPDILSPSTPELPFHMDLDRPLREIVRHVVTRVEKHYIRKALMKAQGNLARCARICGLSRRSTSHKITTYQIDRAAFKNGNGQEPIAPIRVLGDSSGTTC
jgi:transcriptional regulator with PAS, ATPase and Fis domain